MESISVIICTYNGAQHMEASLRALMAQTGIENVPVEVIVVDNASTDDTAAIVRRVWNHPSIEMKLLYEERPSVRIARETGYQSSRHEFLCWVDDDNILSPDYLTKGLAMFRKYPNAGICGGRGIPVGPVEKPDWLPKGWGSHGVGPQGTQEGPVSDQRQYVYGAGSIMRRSAFEEIYGHGFQPLLTGRSGASLSSGEDLERSFALGFFGWQVVQSPGMTFDHAMDANRFSWDYCFRIFHNYGQASAIQNLYFMFLGKGWKFRFKRTWPGVLFTMVFNRFFAFFYRQLPKPENDPKVLKRQTVIGRADALKHFHADGSLRKYYLQIKELHRRGEPFRRQRQAATS